MYQHAGINTAIKHGLLDLEKIHIGNARVRVSDAKEHGVGGIAAAERDPEIAFEFFAFGFDEFGAIPLTEAYSSSQQGIFIFYMRIERKTDGTDVVGALECLFIERLDVKCVIFEAVASYNFV